ncbi:peptidoglycan hydrolase-like protein with peptidoglycan-binding domain [Luteibacter sp. 621]|uniref:XVIPCD domain-containing protein n=1 Tax=Luteibacter sp. 621 TaxID=3373916 RepID=UPI003D1B0EB6
MTQLTTDQLRRLLTTTETSDRPETLNTFSYAGTGQSTYSFGLLQVDVGSDHGGVKSFLRDNGFTEDQVRELSRQGGLNETQLAGLNRQLQAIPQDRVDQFMNSQLQDAVDRINGLVDQVQLNNPAVGRTLAASPELQLALADYDNQYGIDGIGRAARPNTMLAYLEGHEVTLPGGTLQLQGDSLTRTDIGAFVASTAYATQNQRAAGGRAQRLEDGLRNLGLASPADPSHPSPLRHRGTLAPSARSGHPDIAQVQTTLDELGYRDATGHRLALDGHAGPATKAAVEAFQRASGLQDDGIVGAQTMRALREQAQAASSVTPGPLSPSLDLTDRDHPDHTLYASTLALVHDLDRRQGRQPDQHSANLAASLVVSARRDGLSRIDQVELSTDASRVWGVERPPGVRDHFFDRHTNVQTMEAVGRDVQASSQQWPQAMQAFQDQQQQAQSQAQQRQQEQAQQQQPSGPTLSR